MIFITTILAAMLSTCLRGVQNKVVAAGDKVPAFVVGSSMLICDLTVVAAVAKLQSPQVIGAAAIGAGMGWIIGMVAHDYFTRNKRHAIRKMEKAKLKERIRKEYRKMRQQEEYGKNAETLMDLLSRTNYNEVLIDGRRADRCGFAYTFSKDRRRVIEIHGTYLQEGWQFEISQIPYHEGAGVYEIVSTEGRTMKLTLYTNTPVLPLAALSMQEDA